MGRDQQRSQQTIDILHLSDLHFGAHSRFRDSEPAEQGERFYADLAAACKDLPAGPKVDVVVVTGDLAETGDPDEFSDAEAFLGAVAGAMGIDRRRFVFVPGNHDVSWPLCEIEESKRKYEKFDDATLRERIDQVKLRFYEETILRFYGATDLAAIGCSPLGFGAWIHDYDIGGLPLSIAALNSCERESHRQADHLGEVSERQIKALLDRWLEGDEAHRLKIVAVHHNPVGTTITNEEGWRAWLKKQNDLSPDLIDRFASDMTGLEGKQHLRALCTDARVQLVLHGHHHAKDEQGWDWQLDGRTFVMSAGSLTLEAEKLPRDEPLSVRLIRLDANEPRITAWPLTFIGWARTRGQLEKGAFTRDPAIGAKGFSHPLSLPERWRPAAADGKTGPTTDNAATAAFTRSFRAAMRQRFSTWELATAGTVGMSRRQPVTARLDDMYVDLRLGEGYDPRKLDRGERIGPDTLLARGEPLVVRGPAGSGKTTWMHWMFRRLVDTERALPLMIELRRLALAWRDAKGAQRALPTYLDQWAAEYMGTGWEGATEAFLEAELGPIPVLLVDGWDELGPLGEDVRGKLLAFLDTHPRVRVVVSSRPYGEKRPSRGEGFATLDLQPLDDEEMRALIGKFYRHCQLDDDVAGARDADDFWDRLGASAEAKALGRTPLTLTMLLLVGSREALPDKRHELYEVCIRTLLYARPKGKEEEGALPAIEHFRPEDSEERLRALAELALGVQTAGYKKKARSALPFAMEEAKEHLPTAWSHDERVGFVAWLSDAAGVLTDRADGTFAFTHLSFQELLSAWQLHATHGDDRVETFAQLGSDGDWWETLVLWAALVHKQNPVWIDQVIARLGESAEHTALAGAILADGLATSGAFSGWLSAFPARFAHVWPHGGEVCARMWAASRQDQRRADLIESFRATAAEPTTRWLCWHRLDLFYRVIERERALPLPADGTLAAALLGQQREAESSSAAGVAASRILSGSFPAWPADKQSVGLLHLWPGSRRLAGLRLQTAAVMGATRDRLAALTQIIATQLTAPADNQARDLARDLARYLARYLARDLARDWARDLARYLARDWARYLVSDLASDLARYLARYLARDWARDWARYLARYLARDLARDVARYLARDLARAADLDPNEAWLEAFALTELYSFGRHGARAWLANAQGIKEWPEARMLRRGAVVSLHTGKKGRISGGKELHPLWPALARHVARCATDHDRTLLEKLAREPQKHLEDGPLRWGLQFIVRGDVMLDGGEVVTLDELCDETGVERLPYLEDIPPELEIDWDAEG